MAPDGGLVVALLLTQMPFCAARVSCAWMVVLGIPLVRMPAGFSWIAEFMAACWVAGVDPEIRSLYFQPMSAAACAQYWASTLALPRPESRPTSSFPAAGLLVSGVVMPIVVGVFRNCCSYCCAAAMPALVALAVEPALVSPPLALLVLLVLLLLLLHAAMASVEVATATTAASVLLIRASFCTAARKARAAEGLLGSC